MYTTTCQGLTDVHTLEFNFHTITNPVALDALVFALSLDLWSRYRIQCNQIDECTLVFSTAQHCTIAQLALSSDTRYTLTRR